MTLTPVLTEEGRDALLAAQLGDGQVVLTSVAFGSAARAPTGEETALVSPFAVVPVTSSSQDTEASAIKLNVQVDGAEIDITEAHPVREVGVFDAEGRLIFYWSTLGSLGAITPDIAYALAMSITLAPADAEVIQIVDGGPPFEAVFEERLLAVEAQLQQPASPLNTALVRARRRAWTTLFLAHGA
jgi:hypothetical protein